MSKPEFDLSSIRSIRSAAITEFTPVYDSVARVIATFVGSMDPSEAIDRLTAVMGNRARPIQSSFRWLEEGRSAIGFVTLAKAVREFTPAVTARMHKINANLFTDAKDESLWEVKTGVGGSYLARQGQDNLAELLEASRVSVRSSAPRMAAILSASVRRSQFVAYVTENGSMVDYGFCVAAPQLESQSVLSSTTGLVDKVPQGSVVGVYTLEIPGHVRAALGKEPLVASADTDRSIEYYKKAYAYAPEYVAEVVKQIEQMASF